MGVLPEEPTQPPSASQTNPYVTKDEKLPFLVLPGSLIESTTEQQASVTLIALPNTGSKRPANNVDQMMSYIEEPSRRHKDTTIITELHCLAIDVIFLDKL